MCNNDKQNDRAECEADSRSNNGNGEIYRVEQICQHVNSHVACIARLETPDVSVSQLECLHQNIVKKNY